MSQFKKGDMVTHKTGGPVMIVIETGDYSYNDLGYKDGVKCEWHHGGEFHVRQFDAHTLEGD